MAETAQIHLLYGNDEYAISRRAHMLADVFADPSEAEMNTTRLDARSMTEDQWINAISVLPFLVKHRVVVLSDPSARFARRRSKDDPTAEAEGHEKDRAAVASKETAQESRQKFLASLEHVAPGTILIITETLEFRSKQDREAAARHWLAKWMREHRWPVELLTQPAGDSMAGWISREAKSQGGAFSAEAARKLAEMAGTDTRQASQEVTKLLTYVNWSRPVSAADVETLSPRTAEPDIFKMVDALAVGNAREAQFLLHRLLEFQDVFGTWGMIVRQFRYLLVARDVLDGGGGARHVAEALSEVEGRRISEFAAEKAMNQARRFSMVQLEQIYRRLLAIDEAAKTGQMPLEVSLDLLVLELAKP